MDRRSFFSATGAAGAASALRATAAPAAHRKLPPLKARLGHQFGALTEQSAAWVARFGVDAICTRPVTADPARLYPTVDELKVMLDIADRHKVRVEIVDSVLLQSSDIDKEKHAGIVLGLSPERDREIEAFQNHLRNCAATGIRCIK
ncbi:MAG: D-mannonate dehydratase, partial [Alphaproteobacteria bacterium]|nr:D-mannonate dehydratase [Alphaproteobacteria bacterium]